MEKPLQRMEYTKSRTLNNVIDNTLIICVIVLTIASAMYVFYKYEEYAYADTYNFETGCPNGENVCAEHHRLKCHGGRIIWCASVSFALAGIIGGCVALIGFALFLCYLIGIEARRTFHRIVREYDECDARVTEEQKSRIQ